jgi:cytidylate kinase
MAILTISRQYGSLDRENSQAMARVWHYEYVDRRKIIFEDMAAQGADWEKFGREFDEHYPNVWERFDRSFKGFVTLGQSIILNYALKDNVMIIGRGGNFLLREVPYSLNVRIVAPLKQRIEAIMAKEGLSDGAAELLIKKVDKEMARLVNLIYGKNIDDPSAYDLFFDAGVMPMHDIMAAIRAALLEKDRLKTDEAVAELKMKALAKKVQAAVMIDPKLFVPIFNVIPGKDRLLVTGVVHSPEERTKVEAIVKKTAQAVPVEFSLHHR